MQTLNTVDIRRRILLLIVTLTIVVVVLSTFMLSFLYTAARDQLSGQLIATARSQASLINSVALFDSQHSKQDHPEGAVGATLVQINAAFNRLGTFGETGELVFGMQIQDKVVILMHSRADNPPSAENVDYREIQRGTRLAIPLQLALDNQTGIVTSVDYANREVLAAYAPVPALSAGLVAKIDLQEIREPYIRAGLICLIAAGLMIAASAVFFRRITRPVIWQLQDSENYNRTLFELSPIGLALCRMDGSLVDVNPAYAAIIGRSVQETLDLTYWQITPSDYMEQEKLILDELEVEGTYGPYEKEYFHASGHRVPVNLNGKIIYQGGEKLIWSSVEDISERITAVSEISRTREQLELLMDSTGEAIYGVDIDGNCTFANPACLELTGYGSVADILGKNMHHLIHHSHADGRHYDPVECKISQAHRSGVRVYNDQEVFWRKNGDQFPVEYRSYPMRRDNQLVGSVVTFNDISERRKTEAELARYRDQLEEVVEQRTSALKRAQEELMRSERLATLGQLTATVSHELRNPLGAMKPAIYIIRKRSHADDDVLQGALMRLDRGIDRCDRIIDELLDYTRTISLDRQVVEIDDWITSLVKEQSISGDITVKYKLGLPEVELAFDPSRLRRALINVIENACHAMSVQTGSNTVARPGAVLEIGSAQQAERYEIHVKDNGNGMSEDVLARVFEPLFSTKGFGVGLGMPAVKQIMEQHGGGIDIETKSGSGTHVVLWLPQLDQDQAAA